MRQDLLEANPFVAQLFPNAPHPRTDPGEPANSRLTAAVRTLLALILGLPSPIIEAMCRWLQSGGATLVEMPTRRHSNDLFELFPDLPGHPPRAAEDQLRRVHQQVEEFRERARVNIDRQRASAARMRARVANRKRR